MPIPGQSEFPKRTHEPAGWRDDPTLIDPMGMAPPEMRLIDTGALDGNSPPATTEDGENDGSLAGLLVGGLAVAVSALILFGTMKGVRR